MKTLITPIEVLHHAFAGTTTLSQSFITEDDIAAAEARYIVPIIGRQLYERLLEGLYPSLRDDYLKTCTALYTRLLLQPRLDLSTASIGTLAPRSEQGSAANESARNALRTQLRIEANTLLRRAVAYLENHAEDFPEYKPTENPLNHCSCYGGYLQIH